MSPLFEISGLCFSYGSRKVLDDLSLSVNGGEFCALLGLNGSGKSTLLRAACGLLPAKGTVTVSGQDTVRLDEKKRARLISYIPQVSGTGEGISVLDAVMMGFTSKTGLFGYPTAQQYRTAEALLARFGKQNEAQRDFSTLSQGEKQIVILARCMAQGAPVMLMDEPDSSLDFVNRHRMLAAVRDTVKQTGAACITAAHDPNFALRYCDRIMVLSEGRITAELEPEKADAEIIKKVLSPVYGKIDVVEYQGGFLVGAIK